MFNCFLQLGGSVGVAAANSIVTSVDGKSGDPDTYAGRAAAWWFVLGIVGVETVVFLLFYKPRRKDQEPSETPFSEVAMSQLSDKEKDMERGSYVIPDEDVNREETRTMEC